MGADQSKCRCLSQDGGDTAVCRQSREIAYDTDWVRQALDADEKVSVTVRGQDGVDTAVAGRIGRLSRDS